MCFHPFQLRRYASQIRLVFAEEVAEGGEGMVEEHAGARPAHDAADARYGNRIEGSAPEGFVLAGTADFTGNDTIPTGDLATNAAPADVYYAPDDPNVLLLATHWSTAPDESGEIEHAGFDVYIRYNFPLASTK